MKTAISFVLGVPALGAMYFGFWALVPLPVSVCTSLYFKGVFLFIKFKAIPFGVYT